MPHIQLPNGWTPRSYQEPLWDYLMDGGTRAMAIWHRRAGKDDVALHATAIAAHRRTGNFWHCLPEYAQARKAVFTAVNPHTGKRRIDEAFPPEIRESTNESEMFIRFKRGGPEGGQSTWQCIGSDNYSRVVGSSAAGCVFSEYALANPSAWAYMRPMLAENNGFALFITTPRGHNHAKDMYDFASKTEGWFSQILGVNATGALNKEQQAEALAEYQALYGLDMGLAAYRQEYECDFSSGTPGSFYAREMGDIREQGRITDKAIVPIGTQVNWAWDLGVSDDTALWAFVPVGSQLFIVGFYAASGVGLDHYVDVIEKMEREHGWAHGTDYVPHDAKVKEWGSGRTRVETMSSMGLKPLLVRLASIDDGINAVRRTLPLCVFHPRCQPGLDALDQYRREWDDDKKAFRASAVHDWTSHPADAFRYLAMGWQPAPRRIINVPRQTGFVIPPPDDNIRKGIRL